MVSRNTDVSDARGAPIEALGRASDAGAAMQATLDDLVTLAVQIADVPMACVSITHGDHAGLHAAIGFDGGLVPSDLPSFEHGGVLVETANTTAEDRFAGISRASGGTKVRFYAGQPLVAPDGTRFGLLRLLAPQERRFDAGQWRALAALARQVVDQLALRQALSGRASDELRQMRILESATDYAIVSLDLGGKVTSWNEGAHRIMGWSEAEMLGRRCDDFFTIEDRTNRIPDQEMAAALANGRGADERWHLRKDGTCFWANGVMMPLSGEGGTPVGFVKILRDRTEQHRTRKALEAIEQRFQLALDAAGFVGSWDWDIRADRLTADAAIARSYSVDVAEAARGLPIEFFVEGIHPDDREHTLEGVRRCIEETGQFAEEYRLLANDGSVRWVFARGRAVFDDDGAPIHFPGVALDITARKQLDDTLRESEARTRFALAAADTGIWQAAADLSGIDWDARACELLGHAPGATIDRESAFLASVHPDDRAMVETMMRAALVSDGEGTFEGEFRTISRVDGRTRWINARGSATGGLDDQRRLIGTVRDIGAEKAAQAHQEMLSNELQHRIKNTLAVVQAIVSQTLRTTDDAAAASQAIASRIVTLSQAHDLLTQTSWTAAPIRAIIAGASAPHLDNADRLVMTGPVMRLDAKPALALAMVIHELCTNAVKYGALSVPGGRVTIDWRIDGTEARDTGSDDAADGARFIMVWQEHGGPPVTAPSHKGFGTRLIESSLAGELGGSCDLTYQADGFRWTLSADPAAIREG